MQQRVAHSGTRTAVNDRLKAMLSDNAYGCRKHRDHNLMEELHTDSIDGGRRGQLCTRSRAWERATPTLRKILDWADGQDERYIFWLSGLAGTGKSTIARTVARRHDGQK